MKAEEYLNAAWRYWGVDAAPEKPDASQLSDDELYRVQLMDEPGLPHHAHAEIMSEWDKRRCRVKVYRENSPRKKR